MSLSLSLKINYLVVPFLGEVGGGERRSGFYSTVPSTNPEEFVSLDNGGYSSIKMSL